MSAIDYTVQFKLAWWELAKISIGLVKQSINKFSLMWPRLKLGYNSKLSKF